LTNEFATTVLIPIGKERYLFGKFFKDGYEVASDTVKYEYTAVKVGKENTPAPYQFSLYQNYPNPFNPVTTICYDLQSPAKVKLKVYDCLGKEVALLVNGNQKAGSYSVRLASDNMSSGIYFYSLEADHFKIEKKMLLLK
jgi:hypothetical protein